MGVRVIRALGERDPRIILSKKWDIVLMGLIDSEQEGEMKAFYQRTRECLFHLVIVILLLSTCLSRRYLNFLFDICKPWRHIFIVHGFFNYPSNGRSYAEQNRLGITCLCVYNAAPLFVIFNLTYAQMFASNRLKLLISIPADTILFILRIIRVSFFFAALHIESKTYETHSLLVASSSNGSWSAVWKRTVVYSGHM